MNWLKHMAGLDDPSGMPYLFYSGIGGKFAMMGAMTVLYRRHICNQRNCWRPARHRIGHDVFCFKHSPHDQPGKKQST